MRLHRRVLSNLEVGHHGRAYGRAGLTQGWVVGGMMRCCESPIAGGGGWMRGMGREHEHEEGWSARKTTGHATHHTLTRSFEINTK